MAAPADLSTCDRCGRPVPPSNRPQFADWQIVKEDGRVKGMRCPSCQAQSAAEE
jgi:DNA-directed RNA polymerase subunit RPC12/RpoP